MDVLTQNKLEFAPVLRSGSKTDCMGFLDMTDLVGFVVDIASTGDIENDRVSIYFTILCYHFVQTTFFSLHTD